MSEENNVIDFVSKAKKQEEEITDEEFQMVLDALFGKYKGIGYISE